LVGIGIRGSLIATDARVFAFRCGVKCDLLTVFGGFALNRIVGRPHRTTRSGQEQGGSAQHISTPPIIAPNWRSTFSPTGSKNTCADALMWVEGVVVSEGAGGRNDATTPPETPR
jgi:hypothetical protein